MPPHLQDAAEDGDDDEWDSDEMVDEDEMSSDEDEWDEEEEEGEDWDELEEKAARSDRKRSFGREESGGSGRKAKRTKTGSSSSRRPR